MPVSYVFGAKGPRAGQRWIAVDDSKLAAAIGPSGWAIPMIPGANMIADYSAEYNYDWVIPGWNAPPAIVDPPILPAPPPPPEPSPPPPPPPPPPEPEAA